MTKFLLVLMIPAAIIATVATSFVRSTVEQPLAPGAKSGVEADALRVKSAFNSRVDQLKETLDSSHLDDMETAFRETKAKMIGDPLPAKVTTEDLKNLPEVSRKEVELQAERREKIAGEIATPPVPIPAGESKEKRRDFEAEVEDLEQQIDQLRHEREERQKAKGQ